MSLKYTESLDKLKLNENCLPIFFSKGWHNLIKKTNTNSIFVYDINNQIVIPIIIFRQKFIKKAEYVYTPIKFDGSVPNKNDEIIFLNKLHKFLRCENICDIILPPNGMVNFKVLPKYVSYYHIGQIYIDLTKSKEELFKGLYPNYRNEIRKAGREGLEISIDSKNIDIFYNLYKSTYLRQNADFSSIEKFFHQIQEFPNNMIIGISRFKGEEETGVSVYFDKKIAYYDASGSVEKTILPGSNKCLLFDVFLKLKDLGIEKIILGSYKDSNFISKKELGIQIFKLRFGAEVQEGYHFIYIVNPFKFKLYMIALRLKSLLVGKKLSIIYAMKSEIKKVNNNSWYSS
jgi:hypothetical protein